MKSVIIHIGLLLLAAGVFAADNKDAFIDQQKELQKIKEDIKQSEQKLKQYKKNEIEIQKKLADAGQKINIDNTVIANLNKELKQLQGQVEETEGELDLRLNYLEMNKRRYLGNIRQFYLSAHRTDNVLSENPNEELVINRQIRYLTSLANFESENVTLAEQQLAETEQLKNELTGESDQVSKLRGKKLTSIILARRIKEQKEKELNQVQRKKAHESDRMLTLKQAAEEMENIIVRLQEEAAQRARNRSTPTESFFASLKGRLLAPYKGKVTESFGNKVDKVTNLRSFTPGISIKGVSGRKVFSVASGTIAYVGELRGYGNFVIINHDDRFFTTYAGLGDILVSKDAYILAGHTIAVSGPEGIVKFEIRDNRSPVDPIEWIQIDSFR